MSPRVGPYLLAAAVFLVDRATKLYIQGNLGLYETWTVIPGFFDIVHTENTGMAFSLQFGSRALLVAVSAAVTLLLCVLLWKAGPERIPLALVLGGASGNLWDRALRGSVTDFLDVYTGNLHWPAFNVADSAITIGVALLLLDMLRGSRAAKGRHVS